MSVQKGPQTKQGLCYDPNDEFLTDKTIWVAELSDGNRVYADDDRPDVNPGSAWLRLRNYLDESDLTIKGLYLSRGDRNVFVQVPESNIAYSVVRGQILIITGGQQISTIVTCSLFKRGESLYWFRQTFEVNTLQLIEQSEHEESKYKNSAIYLKNTSKASG